MSHSQPISLQTNGAPTIENTYRSDHRAIVSEPARARLEVVDFSARAFVVWVGKTPEDSEPLTVHSDLLFRYSRYFLNRKEEIDKGRSFLLKDEDPGLFNDYLNCVYRGRDILGRWRDEHPRQFGEHDDRDEKHQTVDKVLERLVKLNLLSKRLMDCETRNIVSDEIIRFCGHTGGFPSRDLIIGVYLPDQTRKEDPLRKLLRDYWIFDAGDRDPRQLRNDGYALHFILDFEKARDEIGPSEKVVSDNREENPCCYHYHEDGTTRCVLPISSQNRDFWRPWGSLTLKERPREHRDSGPVISQSDENVLSTR